MGWLVQSFAVIFWAIACHEITNFSAFCVQLSNCKFSGSKYWHPGDDCRPKNCSSEKWPYRCEIGNYDDNFPNACLDHKRQQAQRKHQHDAGMQGGVAVEESDRQCFAKLARINLYTYSCLAGVIGEKRTQFDEVSLKFSFHPPSCDDQPVDTAVMAEFNAKNDSRNPYFMVHQICRVFNYSSRDANKFVFTSSDKGEISYDCIGIGLRYAYPEIYYYLGLTTFPSGALLNYTIVFLDVVNDSMRLVAAAWLSPSQIHVVFDPIVGVANYMLRVTSGDWEIRKEASAALPSVEISDIPRKVNIVTTFITPADTPVCADMKGCGISITLHRPISVISADVPSLPSGDVSRPGPPLPILLPCILGVLVIIIIACILLLVWRRRHVTRNRDSRVRQHQASAPKFILLLGPHLSAGGCQISQTLAREGIPVKTMLKEKKHSEDPSVINDRFSVILIVFSSADFRVKPLFTTYMRTIFSNRPMWGKIKIVFQGIETLSPRDLLRNRLRIESPKFGEFLDKLSDPDIFYLWPKKKNELIEELKHPSEERETDIQIDEDGISLIAVQPLPQFPTAHNGLMEETHVHYGNGAVLFSDDAEPDYATPAESESDPSESQRDPAESVSDLSFPELDTDKTFLKTNVTEDSGNRLQGQTSRMPVEKEESGDSLAIGGQPAHLGIGERRMGSKHVGNGGISSDFHQNPQAAVSDSLEVQRGYISSSWCENVQTQFDSRGGFGAVGSIGERCGTYQQSMPASLFSTVADDMSAAGRWQDSYASRAQGSYSLYNPPAHAHAETSNVNSPLCYVHSGVPGYYTASHIGRGNHVLLLPIVTSQQHVSHAPPSSAVQSVGGRSPNPLAHATNGTAAVQMARCREPTQNSYHSVNSDSGLEGPLEFQSASHFSQPSRLLMLNEIDVHVPSLLNNPGAEGEVEATVAGRDWQGHVGDGAQGRNGRPEHDDVVWGGLPENNVGAAVEHYPEHAVEHYWGPNQESNDSGMQSFYSDEDDEPGH